MKTFSFSKALATILLLMQSINAIAQTSQFGEVQPVKTEKGFGSIFMILLIAGAIFTVTFVIRMKVKERKNAGGYDRKTGKKK